MIDDSGSRPLDGIKVLELGQLLAGPFTGTLLGYFGADVIKVEPPKTGDPIRQWRILKDDTSLWWRSLARNKKCVTLDLKSQEGREIVKQLVDQSDVLIENFRPGTMEKWGLGPDEIKKTNPNLIYTRISGYGQTGPNSHKPGYASVTEAYSGFRYVNGFPGDAPVRPNLSMGDSLAGLHAAMGILLALLERQKSKYKSGEKPGGQVVDIALYESIFNLMEGVVPEYDGAQVIREPSGTTLTGIVPTNTYSCKDKKFVVIGGNGDSIFKRLMKVAGYTDMANDTRMATNVGRVEHEQEIDAALAQWTSTLTSQEVLDKLEEAKVPGGPIYNVADMFNDPHYKARGLFESVDVEGEPLTIPAILPKLNRTPGRTEWAGPAIGSHNKSVYMDELRLSEEEYNSLIKRGVI
ncbi:MAG: CoA transferase [Pseudomonadales bacterium]|nr:CoA transferase [Pseudomonadales bacterium]